MKNERAILEAALQQQQHQQQLYPLTEGTRASPGDGEEVEDDELLLLDSPLAAAATTGGINKGNEGIHDEHAARYGIGSVLVPGKKLDGPPAYVVSVPESFRHKYQQSAAVVRQWERQVSDAGILEGRLFISSKRGYPLVVSSVIQYKPGSESEKRLRAKQVNERGAEAFDCPVPDWRGVRYCRLLHAEWAPCSAERDARDGGHHQHQLYGEGGEGGSDAGGMVLPCGVRSGAYDPSFLDDPALSHGRTRQLNTGGPGLGPVVFSIILLRNPKQLKDELNRQFREQHPSLPPSLTLSKIRRLKKQAAQGCYHGLDIELGTLALAVTYFEKLCLQSLVTRTNRRLAFATCLVLAYKFQEQGLQGEGGRKGGRWGGGRGVRGSSAGSGGSVRNSSNKLSSLLGWIDRELLVSKKQVLDAEFGVFHRLGFALHVPAGEVQFHFSRLCRLVGVLPREYLGEERLRAYMEAAAGMVPGVVGWREGEDGGEEEEEKEEGGGGGEEEEGDEDYGMEETMQGDQDQVEEEDEEEDELDGSLWRRGRRLRRQGQRQMQQRTAVSLPPQGGRRDFERAGKLLEENVPDALAFSQHESPGRVRGLEEEDDEEEDEEEEEEKKPRRRPSWTMRGWKLGRRQTTV